MNTYHATHTRKGTCQVEADTSYAAQKLAAQKLGVKKAFEVSVYLIATAGNPVNINTASL